MHRDLDLDLGDIILGQGHDKPLVVDNSYEKYYQFLLQGYGVMVRTRFMDRWTDRQTG